MSTLAATYFDGKTARPHAVTLTARLEGPAIVWDILGETVNASHDFESVRLTPPLGRTRRFLHLPGGGFCEMDDHEGLDAALVSVNRAPVNSRPQRMEKFPVLIAVLTLLIAIGGVAGFQWSLPFLARQVAYAVPDSLEHRLGRGTLEALDYQIFKPTQLSSLRQLDLKNRFSEFTRKNNFPGTVHLKFRRMYDNTANAFALPDGTIVVSDRLVEIARDDDEILAVLAHELGHLHHRHSLRQLLEKSVTLLLVTSVTGDTSSLGNFAGALPLVVLTAKYSRNHEREADAFALSALTRASVPPDAFLRIMTRLEEDTVKIYADAQPPFLSTHPPTAERIETYRKAADRISVPQNSTMSEAIPPRDP